METHCLATEARTPQAVLAIFEEEGDNFNAVNIATAIHRTAVHTARLPASSQDIITSAPAVCS